MARCTSGGTASIGEITIIPKKQADIGKITVKYNYAKIEKNWTVVKIGPTLRSNDYNLWTTNAINR